MQILTKYVFSLDPYRLLSFYVHAGGPHVLVGRLDQATETIPNMSRRWASNLVHNRPQR